MDQPSAQKLATLCPALEVPWKARPSALKRVEHAKRGALLGDEQEDRVHPSLNFPSGVEHDCGAPEGSAVKARINAWALARVVGSSEMGVVIAAHESTLATGFPSLLAP